jgi:putative lipase involved disintegration of autophagic bodies
MSATRIRGVHNFEDLTTDERECYFHDLNDEGSDNLTYHKFYSQASCHLECYMALAMRKLEAERGIKCYPWYLPNDGSVDICNPWQARLFKQLMVSSAKEDPV